MRRQVSSSTKRSYGVQRVTRVWGTSRATLYRHRRGAVAGTGRRPGPRGAVATSGRLAFETERNRTCGHRPPHSSHTSPCGFSAAAVASVSSHPAAAPVTIPEGMLVKTRPSAAVAERRG